MGRKGRIKHLDKLDRRAYDFVVSALNLLTPEALEYGIKNDVDPRVVVFNHFKLGNRYIRPIARFFIRAYWKEISAVLSDVRKVYEILATDPRRKKILDTPEGRNYLNNVCFYMLQELWRYAFL